MNSPKRPYTLQADGSCSPAFPKRGFTPRAFRKRFCDATTNRRLVLLGWRLRERPTAYQFDWSHEIVLINGVTTTVKVVRERSFTPRLRFKSYDELNAWLLDRCITYARSHRPIEQPERIIWEVFDAGTSLTHRVSWPSDGFHA